jgi:nucleotide-binding universal stress UspA family protein
MTTQTHHLSAERDTRPVVVGYDGSPSADAALDRSIVMARALGVPLRLVSTWQYPTVYGEYPLSGWTLEADTAAVVTAALTARFGHDVPTWLSSRIVEGGAAHVLIDESRDAQMLVVGSRGHGGFVGLLLGSVSSACAEHASSPVLVMHAPIVDHDNAIDAGAEALGDGSRASDRLAGAAAS